VDTLITLALMVLSGLGMPGKADFGLPADTHLLFSGIDFFSGEVADISSGSIEVVRSALGKNDQRRFSLTDETKFEGRAKRGSRVTVGYYAKSPEVAVTVIVRDE
jgi:hypothetical protein